MILGWAGVLKARGAQSTFLIKKEAGLACFSTD
jgi:hypothetical protein